MFDGCSCFLSQYSEKADEREEKDVSTDILVELTKLVLKNNYFYFNEKKL